MRVRIPAALALGAALLLAGCRGERRPCALWDCGGACVDVRLDPAHCGACGRACPAGQVCSGGACALECEAPLAACERDGALACVSIRTDATSCGACGIACPAGQVCAGGACARECAAPLVACGAGEGAWCADLARDRLNCGSCGSACAPGLACADGVCVAGCAPEALCDGSCVDLWTDPLHCGACGNACGAGARCAGAACRDACELDGLSRCGPGCADLASDPASCGACGRACPAGALCVAGDCVAPACATGPYLPGAPDLLGTSQSAALLAADVDGDALPDLLFSEVMGARVVLRRALAGGGFAPPEDAIAAAATPFAAADMDGDGDLDLLVGVSGAVAVYVNDGSGRFSAGTSYAARDASQALAADLDGDGRLDVAAGTVGFVHVFLAAAPGAPATHQVGWSSMASLRAADVDGDGRPDLIATPYHGSVSVLRNQGDGTFAAPVVVSPDLSVESLQVADLDGDGDPDAVVVGRRLVAPPAYALGVLRNDAGVLTPAATQTFSPTGYLYYDLVVADLDGDGRPDAATGEIDAYHVFRNQGDGTFAPPVAAVSGGAQSLAALDADRDGRVDLVAASATMSAVEIRRQLAGGAWAGPDVLPIPARSALLADLDGDGRDDLVTMVPAAEWDGRPLGTIEIRLAGPAGLGPPSSASGFGWWSALAGDLDRDGAVDLVVLRDGAPGVLRNLGGGSLADEVPVLDIQGAFALADVTGDGVPDLLGTTRDYPEALQVAVGYGNGGFAPPVETRLPSGSWSALAAADVDGDGRADAVVLAYGYAGGRVLRVHPGRPDGTFGSPWERTITVGGASSFPAGLAAGDLDGDGRADVAALFQWSLPDRWAYEGAVAIVRGGPAGPGEVEVHPSVAPGQGIAIGDLSGGGRRDVVVVAAHSLGVLAAREGGALAAEVRWAVPGSPGSPAIGDLDGDLRGDVVVPTGDRVIVYRGACPAP